MCVCDSVYVASRERVSTRCTTRCTGEKSKCVVVCASDAVTDTVAMGCIVECMCVCMCVCARVCIPVRCTHTHTGAGDRSLQGNRRDELWLFLLCSCLSLAVARSLAPLRSFVLSFPSPLSSPFVFSSSFSPSLFLSLPSSSLLHPPRCVCLPACLLSIERCHTIDREFLDEFTTK